MILTLSKVSNLRTTMLIKKYVVTLDISMYNTLRMQITYSRNYFGKYLDSITNWSHMCLIKIVLKCPKKALVNIDDRVNMDD